MLNYEFISTSTPYFKASYLDCPTCENLEMYKSSSSRSPNSFDRILGGHARAPALLSLPKTVLEYFWKMQTFQRLHERSGVLKAATRGSCWSKWNVNFEIVCGFVLNLKTPLQISNFSLELYESKLSIDFFVNDRFTSTGKQKFIITEVKLGCSVTCIGKMRFSSLNKSKAGTIWKGF